MGEEHCGLSWGRLNLIHYPPFSQLVLQITVLSFVGNQGAKGIARFTAMGSVCWSEGHRKAHASDALTFGLDRLVPRLSQLVLIVLWAEALAF